MCMFNTVLRARLDYPLSPPLATIKEEIISLDY
jgi:hypothetical protein